METGPFQMHNSSDHLTKITRSYIDFINQVSQGEEFDPLAVAQNILAPNCKKVFNGTVFTETREDFVADLLKVYRENGAWKIRPVDIILSPDSDISVIRLFVDMENFGHFTEIVILRFDSAGLIKELNIVFNKVEEKYNFEGA